VRHDDPTEISGPVECPDRDSAVAHVRERY
jgi:hypothetical protein